MSAEAAKRALDDGDTDQALAAALAAWRETRSAVIAEVIEAVDSADPAPQPKGRTKEDFQRAWIALARSEQCTPREVGALARALRKKVPIAADYFGILRPEYTREKYAAPLARLEALAQLGPDPRLAAAVAELLRAAPFSAYDAAGAETVYGTMLRALVALGDPRQLVAMRELAASPRARRATVRDYLARALPNAIAQLEAVSVSSIDDEQRWRALLPARDDAARDGRSASELLAAIYQDPDDDDSRRVYADLLQEAGDPRGELIGLQLQQARGAASSKEERRVRALLRAHRGQWIGEDLERVLNKVVFERGFLFAAELAQNAVATDEIWQRAAADERLATLRELHKGRGSARRLQLFVEGAARNLTSLEVPSNTILDVLVGLPGPRALQALSLPRPPSRKKLAAMVEASSLANLRRLTLTIDPGDIERVLGDLRRYRLLERLQALTLQPSGYQVEDGPAVMRLWAELPVKLSYLAYGHEHARFVIERRADGRCIARCVGWAADFAAAFASALPGEVRELVFTPCKHGGPTPEKQAIAAATRGRVEPLEVRFEGY